MERLLSQWDQCNHGGPFNWKTEAEEGKSKRWQCKKFWAQYCCLSRWRNGAIRKEIRETLEDGNAKKWTLLPEPPERIQSGYHYDFSPVISISEL